ncbi:MAG: ribokinase [Oscillospiraceae bacterium]|nr:ribokinase [Oscillospiraceae bacterium]
MKKIIVVGSANMDLVIRVSHIPAEGETILAKGVQLYPGGKGANQAVAVARLGGDVTMIGCVGEDDHGRELLAQMADCGVNTAGVEALDDVPTGAAYIKVSDAGENNIVVNPGANERVSPEMLTRYSHLFDGAAYCIIQLEVPIPTLYALVEICNTRGIRLILNPAPAAPLDFDKLQGVWMIAPNQSELDLLVPGHGDSREKARALYQKGFPHVLVTLGAEGCLLVSEEGERTYPAYTALQPVDTTAAGDSFIGALAFGLSRELDLEAAIGLAAHAAGISVSRPGAQASLPTWEEVEVVFLG